MSKAFDPDEHPELHGFYVSRFRDDDTQTIYVRFEETWRARKYLDELFADDEVEWSDSAHPGAEPGCTIVSSSGLCVSTRWWPSMMRRAVEYQYTTAQDLRECPEPSRSEARRYRRGPNLPRTLEEARSTAERQAKRAERKTSAPPRASRDGLVTVADVAEQLETDAKACRVALRKLKIEKPSAGWAWSAAEAEEIREKIRGVL